jgi:type II secretory pathway pseudopilin PulG
MKRFQPSNGFTLVEMTVVIMVLITLLGTGLFVSKQYGNWQLGRAASEELHTLYSAQRIYLPDNPTAVIANITPAQIIPYTPKVKVEAREKHHGRDALPLSFGLRKIDRTTHELAPYKKLKKPVTLWLSDDADRVPLELRAAVYTGDVRAVLTDFKKTP